MNARTNRTLLAVAVTALGLMGILPTSLRAGPPPDVMNSALQTHAQAAKVPEGETVAMVCGKCKTVLLSKVDKKKGFLGWFQPKTKHECPGCGGHFTVMEVPTGDDGLRHEFGDYVHTCSKCGDHSAFCCTTKPGLEPTKGMEKK